MGLFITIACSSNEEEGELLVFAAASLTNALNEIGAEFEADSGIDVSFNYGASQSLAQQAASGAPADLIISAGQAPIDFLVERELLDSEPVNILTNKLVIVMRQGETPISSVQEITSVERVAIADPELAPAGQYAKDSLTTLGLWDAVQPRLIIGSNVRVTLGYVETNSADAGFVYSTDAAIGSNIQILDIVPADSYPPIVYPAAVFRDADSPNAASRFLDFLRGETGQSILRKYGFEPLDS